MPFWWFNMHAHEAILSLCTSVPLHSPHPPTGLSCSFHSLFGLCSCKMCLTLSHFYHVCIHSFNIYPSDKQNIQHTEFCFLLLKLRPYILEFTGLVEKQTNISCNTSATVLRQRTKRKSQLYSHLISGNAKWEWHAAFFQLPSYMISTYINLCI